ncbi:sensor histidine kinase [Clostridium oceanicum]|uniref:histidine kinase n=1 Tax=Clostridium oceanicum TaxID=1543 RepID=A0ABP3UNS0_9CLOT
MYKKLNLNTKILLINSFIIFISLLTANVLINITNTSNIKDKIKTNLKNSSNLISKSSIVKDALKSKRKGLEVQSYVRNILNTSEDIDIIVVCDTKSIRYAHPNKDKIGKKFVGGDEFEVINKGSSYISKSTGTMGNQIRSFSPVLDNNKIIGFVLVSSLTENITKETNDSLKSLIFFTFIGFLIGALNTIILSKNIKNSLLGFKPEQLTELYLQKKEVLDTLTDGIVAIDINNSITLCNKAAKNIMNIPQIDVTGKNIYDIIPNSRLPIILKTEKPELNKNMIIENTIIFSNRIPIKQDDNIIGALAIFNDMTKVTKLAEELTGVKQIVEALKANTHEFMNKLHVILGFIQIDETEKAKNYILNLTEEQQLKINMVIKKIENSTIVALLLGKITKAKQYNITLHLDSKSNLKKSNKRITNNILVTIIGNLINNSIDAINICSKNKKIINLFLNETDKFIIIEINDTGCGISEECLDKIFEKGFSTKGKNRGTGLFLLKNIVENLNGIILIDSKENIGTTIKVKLPKEDKIDD